MKFMEIKAKVANWIDNIGKKNCLIEIDKNGKKSYERRFYNLKKEDVIKALKSNEKLIEYGKEIVGE